MAPGAQFREDGGESREGGGGCARQSKTLYFMCVDSVLDEITSHGPNTGSIIGRPYVKPLHEDLQLDWDWLHFKVL